MSMWSKSDKMYSSFLAYNKDQTYKPHHNRTVKFRNNKFLLKKKKKIFLIKRNFDFRLFLWLSPSLNIWRKRERKKE